MVKSLPASLLAILVCLVSACRSLPEAMTPIRTEWIRVHAHSVQDRLVILLPGRGESVDAYKDFGFIRAITDAGIRADVLLVDAHLGYYLSKTLPERFAEDVLSEIELQGYKEVWIGGISLGGLGALLLDREFPETFDQLLLLAPFLGSDRALLKSLETTGLEHWQPPADEVPADDFEYALWAHLKAVCMTSDADARLWLAFGERDRMRRWHRVLAATLPEERVFTDEEGKHLWTTWTPLWKQMLEPLR